MVVLLSGVFWSENFHASSPHELLYVLNGSMTVEGADGRIFPLNSGDVILLQSGWEHRDVFKAGSELKLQLIHFTLENDSEFIAIAKPEKFKNLSAEACSEIRYLLSRIRNDLSAAGPDMLLNESRLNTILQLICRELANAGTSCIPMPKTMVHPAELVRNPAKLGAAAKHYVECNYSKPITLAAAARHFNVSSCYFSHLFRRENGESFIGYLTDLRLREAERLLRDTTMNVSEVARSVGYENPNYFARLFQKRHGFPPSDCREKTFADVRRKK